MIRKAQTGDLSRMMEIYQIARQFMDETGNPTQWGKNYPPEELIREELADGRMYVIEEDGEVHAVFYFFIGPDETYQVIQDGAWLSDAPYGTIHQVASDGKVRGVLHQAVEFASSMIPHLRIDTHQDNYVMQKAIEKEGFRRCGIIYTRENSERIVYEKLAERPVDLHVHTCCSDGTLTPDELVALAKKKGLAAIAITDHDTVSGVSEALEAGKQYGIQVVPGIEMSTVMDGKDVHLVGLFVKPENEELQACLADARAKREDRNRRSLKQLREAGIAVTDEDLKELGEGRVLTRGNLAELLVKKGYAQSVKEAWNQYMKRGQVGYASRKLPTPEECIRVLHAAGALVFVAHTNQIDKNDPEHGIAICRRILDMGADGLETEYCQFDDYWKDVTEKLAEEYSCLRSGGSDFHGTLKAGLELGCGYGNLFVPDRFLRAMETLQKKEEVPGCFPVENGYQRYCQFCEK